MLAVDAEADDISAGLQGYFECAMIATGLIAAATHFRGNARTSGQRFSGDLGKTALVESQNDC
jgi:hypothetical protein